MDKEILCSNCGAKLNDSDIFCPECGQRVEVNETNASEDEKIESGLPENDHIATDTSVIEEKSDRRKISRKNIVILISIIIIAVIIAVGVKVYLNMPAVKYKSALKNYDSKNYTEAAQIFKELGDYKKSKEYLRYSSIEILRNYVSKHGEDTSYKNENRKCVIENITRNEIGTGQISYDVGFSTEDDGVVFIYNMDYAGINSNLYLTLPKKNDNKKIKFSASYFMKPSIFYSRSESADGSIDLSECSKNLKLSNSADCTYGGLIIDYEDYQRATCKDIPESDRQISSVMDKNYERLYQSLSELLKSTKTGITMSDLGFKTA